MPSQWETDARTAAIAYVADLTDDGERPITWAELQAFVFEGQRIPLASQQGIFKPKSFSLPISIRTTPPQDGREPPYQDEITADAFLHYRYRGTTPDQADNRRLKEAMEAGVPLLYLQGISRGVYQADAAAVIEAKDEELTFRIALFPLVATVVGSVKVDVGHAQRRHYMALVKRRVNQAAFRASVLRAYKKSCGLCRLRHIELLDAAHIISDSEGGLPVVTNGISMCKIHHAAYDSDLVGIRPDLVVEVRADVLAEIDGPMLTHGIQEIHGKGLLVPKRKEWRPDPAAIEVRFDRFRAVS